MLCNSSSVGTASVSSMKRSLVNCPLNCLSMSLPIQVAGFASDVGGNLSQAMYLQLNNLRNFSKACAASL